MAFHQWACCPHDVSFIGMTETTWAGVGSLPGGPAGLSMPSWFSLLMRWIRRAALGTDPPELTVKIRPGVVVRVFPFHVEKPCSKIS